MGVCPGSFCLAFLDGPVAMTQWNEKVQNLFRCVGSVVIHWGLAEQSLDVAINMIFNGYNGKSKSEEGILPRQLKRKLRFVRLCLNQLPHLAEFKDEGIALCEKFANLKERRHDLIHGAINDMHQDDGAYGFIKIDSSGEIQVMKEFDFNLRDFPKLERELEGLVNDAIRFGTRLRLGIERREQSP